MCGIVGFINYKQDISKYKNIIINMNNSLSNRGPDEEGYYIKNHVALGHKRLIVIDPDGGKQPMLERAKKEPTLNCPDGGKKRTDPKLPQRPGTNLPFCIVYNGQIYNTKELRQTLEENGFTFEGYSDTEVLLKSYIYYGKEVVHHLNGIFAFAIWDNSNEELFMARDHFGVKPFYYSIIDNTLVFASEVKALFEYPGITAKIDCEGISELFGLRT